MGEHEWAYRRRRPEGTVLDEAVRDNLATHKGPSWWMCSPT